jgi:hypothetical protein
VRFRGALFYACCPSAKRHCPKQAIASCLFARAPDIVPAMQKFKEPEPELHRAAIEGRVEDIRALIKSKGEVNGAMDYVVNGADKVGCG